MVQKPDIQIDEKKYQEERYFLICQINDCQNQISKHGVMSVIDGFSILLDMISASNRRYIQ